MIYSEDVELVQMSNHEKNVQFFPMHHIGKQKFYEHVGELVKYFKSQGYVVYYESVKLDSGLDSLERDRVNRKFRRMMGIHVDSTGYTELFQETGLFSDLVDQPPYSVFGVDEKDVRVDLSKKELVDAYEARFGTVELDARDSSIALGDDYPLRLRLSQDHLMNIILDHRNRYLANYVQASPDKKIVVIYGALHLEGTFEELKKMDPNWTMKKIK
jgi:hypothetical protein